MTPDSSEKHVHTPQPTVAELQATVIRIEAENARQRAEIVLLEQKLLLQKERIATLLDKLYGRSSERRVLATRDGSEQLALSLGEAPTSLAPCAKEASTTTVASHARKPKRNVVEGLVDKEGKFPEEIRREETTLDEGEAAGEIISVKVTERLEITPPELYVHVIRRIVRKHPEEGMTQPAVPPVITARSTVGPGLLAYVIIMKFLWHIPLHRQEQMFKSYGVSISRDRLIRYVIDLAELFRPLYRLLLKTILEDPVVFADETRMLVGKGKKGEKRYTRSYLWPLMSEQGIVFLYAPTRTAETVLGELKHYVGHLQVDGYRVYEQIAGKFPDVTLVFCWAHARRYFVEAEAHYKEESRRYLRFIQVLYRAESLIKLRLSRHPKFDPDATRLALRRRFARPVLRLMKSELERHLSSSKLLPKSLLAQAIAYTLTRFDGLSLYADDPRLHIDSNPIEREIRHVAIGRKNYMFCASEVGAEAAGIMYSLLVSAKRRGTDPGRYLALLLEQIHATDPERLPGLLPHNVCPWPPNNRF